MKILDVSAGNRAVWFDKHYPDTLYIDIRPEVEPDLVMDSRDMGELADDLFDLAIFDPPHVNFGANAELSKTYGHFTTAQIKELIRRTSQELSRVVKADCLMSLKWNDHDQKLDTVLALMPEWEPLVGHRVTTRTKHSSTTFWCLLRNLKSAVAQTKAA